MKTTNKLFYGLLSLVVISQIFWSCSKDDEVLLSNLEVTIDVVDNFSELETEGLYVYATNTIDQTKDSSLVDANNIANFENLIPGSYNISCTKSLTALEAEEVSGYYEEITLNATGSVELTGGINSDITISLEGKPSSSIIIKEVYTAGFGYTAMYKDQYIELYNNSSEVVYADSLYIANLTPQRNGGNDDDIVSTLSFEEFVYANKISRIPGSGTDNPIQPGESLIIALNAQDWTDDGNIPETVNLENADFELYAIDWLEANNRTGNSFFDIDNENVPNMDLIYLNVENGGWFGFESEGASVAILRCNEVPVETILDEDISKASNEVFYTKLRVEDIIDAVDVLDNADASDFKRLPTSIDAGFTTMEEGSFSGKKSRRKVAKTAADGRVIYQDTNNSTEDFEKVNAPE